MLRVILKFSVLIFLVGLLFNSSFASNKVECLLTVNKSPLWNKETVVVEILDFNTKKVIATLKLPATTSQTPSVNSATQSFDCYSHSSIEMQASYTPSIWSTDVGSKYSSINSYNLYEQVLSAQNANISKLEITLEFPKDFVGVPSVVN